jgi:RNA recognition motif-containing protein
VVSSHTPIRNGRAAWTKSEKLRDRYQEMSFTVFLGNLPAWVTSDDIKSWLTAENLVADQIKVIRNPETQESKGFAFIEAPNNEEMQSIITRFDRAPLEDRLLRANPAQPPKGKRPNGAPMGGPGMGSSDRPDRPPRDFRRTGPPQGGGMRRPAPDGAPASGGVVAAATTSNPPANSGATAQASDTRRRERRSGAGGPQSAFAEELAKAL